MLFIVDHAFHQCVRLHNQVSALVECGVNCHVIEFQYHGWRAITSRRLSNGVVVHTIYAPRWAHHFRTLSAELPFFAWFVSWALKRVFESFEAQPTFIHCYNTFAWGGVFNFAKRHKNIACIIDFAEDLPSIMREYDYVKRGVGSFLVNLKKWDALQGHAVRNSDMNIVVTEEAANDYAQRYQAPRSKFITVNNLPNENLIQGVKNRVVEKKHGFQLLYFGDTSLRRGTGLLIRTASRIRSALPNYSVTIAGYNKREQPLLESMIETYNAHDFVTLTGYIPELNLPELMAQSSMGTCPLKRNPHHDTTHANKLFQFMLGGLPLLVSDCTAQANLVRKNNLGLVFTAENDDSFIDAVIKAFQNEEAREGWSENALAFMQKHTLQAELSAYRDFLQTSD